MNKAHQDEEGQNLHESGRAAQVAGDARWHRVYLLVIVWTIVVIAALWLFSKTFSS